MPPLTASQKIIKALRQLLSAVVVLLFMLAILVGISVGLGTILPQPPQPSPQELQLQQAAAAGDPSAKQQLAQMRAEKDARRSELCHLKQACETFAKVRQECAVAGNYGQCLDIKMGDDASIVSMSCTFDGKVALPPDDMPGSVDCWVRNWTK